MRKISTALTGLAAGFPYGSNALKVDSKNKSATLNADMMNKIQTIVNEKEMARAETDSKAAPLSRQDFNALLQTATKAA